MARQDKILLKLQNPDSVMKWSEVVYLLKSIGYKQLEGDGSRVKFENFNALCSKQIKLHKPHPGNEIKDYIKKRIIELMQSERIIE